MDSDEKGNGKVSICNVRTKYGVCRAAKHKQVQRYDRRTFPTGRAQGHNAVFR